MTLQEAVIISAYTKVTLCDFEHIHGYVEKILERPIFTHEFASREIQAEIKEKSKPDFMKICDTLTK